ncbi:MAG: DUF1569 domain-containing protein [Phycisphaerae bacterium]
MSGASVNQRRALRFDSVSEIMPDVRRVMVAPNTLANWSLAQICEHLTYSFVGSLEGFDLRNHRIKRFFIRRKMLQVALTKGIPRGWTVDPSITPHDDVVLEDAVDGLGAAIQRYLDYRGQLHAHPLFGRMSRGVWDRVHCVHSAHHLSFVTTHDTGDSA